MKYALASKRTEASVSNDHTLLRSHLTVHDPPAGGVTEPTVSLFSFSWNLTKQHMTQSALLLWLVDSMFSFYGSAE